MSSGRLDWTHGGPRYMRPRQTQKRAIQGPGLPTLLRALHDFERSLGDDASDEERRSAWQQLVGHVQGVEHEVKVLQQHAEQERRALQYENRELQLQLRQKRPGSRTDAAMLKGQWRAQQQAMEASQRQQLSDRARAEAAEARVAELEMLFYEPDERLEAVPSPSRSFRTARRERERAVVRAREARDSAPCFRRDRDSTPYIETRPSERGRRASPQPAPGPRRDVPEGVDAQTQTVEIRDDRLDTPRGRSPESELNEPSPLSCKLGGSAWTRTPRRGSDRFGPEHESLGSPITSDRPFSPPLLESLPDGSPISPRRARSLAAAGRRSLSADALLGDCVPRPHTPPSTSPDRRGSSCSPIPEDQPLGSPGQGLQSLDEALDGALEHARRAKRAHGDLGRAMPRELQGSPERMSREELASKGFSPRTVRAYELGRSSGRADYESLCREFAQCQRRIVELEGEIERAKALFAEELSGMVPVRLPVLDRSATVLPAPEDERPPVVLSSCGTPTCTPCGTSPTSAAVTPTERPVTPQVVQRLADAVLDSQHDGPVAAVARPRSPVYTYEARAPVQSVKSVPQSVPSVPSVPQSLLNSTRRNPMVDRWVGTGVMHSPRQATGRTPSLPVFGSPLISPGHSLLDDRAISPRLSQRAPAGQWATRSPSAYTLRR